MASLPEEIRVEEHADGVRFVLPLRSMGIFGAIPLIVGTGLVGASLLVGAVRAHDDPLVFWIFVVAFRFCGAVAVLVGLNVLLGRAVVELRGERLRATSKVFGLGWWRSRRAQDVHQVRAVRTPAEVNGRPATSGWMAALADLEARGPGNRRFLLAAAYDLRYLNPLAAELNRRLDEIRTPTP